MKLGEHGVPDTDVTARSGDVVTAVHQHLRLDDRHEPGLLSERCVASQRVCVHPDAVLARDAVADREHGTPFREARPELPARRAVRAARPARRWPFPRCERELLRALVDLDPGDDPLPLEDQRERRSVVARCRIVSSKTITPLMCSAVATVVRSNSR